MTPKTSRIVVKFASFACAVIFLIGNLLSGTQAQAQSAPQTLFTSQLPSTSNSFSLFRYELGMKFRSTKPGKITALRFYKSPSDVSTHVGRLWSATGTQVASVTFTGESASGWQQKALTTPISITANTTYVVSVNVGTLSGSFSPRTLNGLATAVTNGDLSSVVGANGVFGSPGNFPTSSNSSTNYFRDVVFVADAAPTIAKVSGDNQTAAAGSPLTNALVVQVRNGSNVAVAGSAVTFAVTGGGGTVAPTTAVTDASGNASTVLTLGSAAGTNTVSASATGTGSVTFTATGTGTVITGQQVFSTQVPATLDATDGVSYELGMKFRSARGGKISAIRHWKAASETGAHVGRIWDASGTLLATVTFTGESASGWQQQALSAPLVIAANTTYVVSVNVASHFAFTPSGLAASITNGDLSTVADGANGIFGNTGTFPASSFQNANYFRDVVFVADAAPTIAKVSGDNQTGLPGSSLGSPLVVQINDANNNPQPGVTVNFSATAGGGSVSPVSVVTGANGRASANMILGSSGGVNTATASAVGVGSVSFSAIAGPNAVFLENQKVGSSNWRIGSYTMTDIAGYAGALSVERGGTLPFKVSVASPGAYSIEIYRLGYYGGAGARFVFSSGSLNGTTQPACAITDAATRLVECRWATAYTLPVGADWTSGLYLAKLKLTSTGKESPVFFVVRNDASTSSILFQSSFTTSAAYNRYGGYSLYDFSSTGGQRAYKVSFDRPSSELEEYSNLLRYEYNMIRWMESQGYDVSYVTNLDVHTNPSQLSQHKVFLDAGHDEYWSLEMRNAVENARNAGMHLGFFSANTAYWRVRFEPSSTGAANRVMACYKSATPGDPVAPTYRFRDAPNNRPENALLGIMYIGDFGTLYGGFDFVVANATDPYYAFTGLNNGDKLTGLVGYEWDAVVNNGFTPSGIVTLANSVVTPTEIAPGTPTTTTQIANAVRYTVPSGAKVFSTGTIQWVWGLDSDRGFDFVTPPRVDTRVQQIFVNVLRDMGVRPTTPNANLVVP